MSGTFDSTKRSRWTGPAAAALALAVAGLVTGCSQGGTAPAAPQVTPASAASSTTPSATPSAAPASALTCDDLVPKQDVVKALAAGQPSDDWVVLRGGTGYDVIPGGLLTGVKALQGAGGLACSWVAGPPNSEAGPATLMVSILPDAADQWTGSMYGDAPTDQRRTFAGISAAATCGDPGCGATAAVGSSWVRVDLITGSREGGTSAFAKETDDQVFAGLKPAVESAFRTVQDASAAQLTFPAHLPANGKADCVNYLKKAALAPALDVQGTSIATDYQPDPKLSSLYAAAELRVGDSVCHIEDPDQQIPVEIATVTVGPDQAWAVDDVAKDPAQRGSLHRADLKGLVSGEQAVSSCGSSGNICTVLLTLGSDAIQIDNTPHAERLAEAILAAAR
ncbi:hypothetical protein [Amnibacterium endophyticum]|uniref:LigA protein n=1 Tax=Amnibacterium endophyticum TaxID=2109337 RepID=A0ABW4LFU6_9MICO